MNFADNVIKSIKKMEKALNIERKNINKMSASEMMNYYEELIEKVSDWEEENQQELKY